MARSIQGLIAYSTAKNAGDVIAYRRAQGVRMCPAGTEADPGAATYCSVINQRYLRSAGQSNARYCVSMGYLLR